MFLRLVFIVLLFINTLGADNLPKEKHFGVEVNPFYLLILTPGDNSETFLSGTFSYFDHENLVEIAIPLHYMTEESDDYKQFTVDVHYRKFINDFIGGFYYSGFARLAKLEGEAGNSYIKQTKFGLGVGIGFRLFHKSGFYWGASLGLGSYVTGDNDQFVNNLFVVTDDSRLIVDIELFKFGYTF
jgi:hypothetical protein